MKMFAFFFHKFSIIYIMRQTYCVYDRENKTSLWGLPAADKYFYGEIFRRDFSIIFYENLGVMEKFWRLWKIWCAAIGKKILVVLEALKI